MYRHICIYCSESDFLFVVISFCSPRSSTMTRNQPQKALSSRILCKFCQLLFDRKFWKKPPSPKWHLLLVMTSHKVSQLQMSYLVSALEMHALALATPSWPSSKVKKNCRHPLTDCTPSHSLRTFLAARMYSWPSQSSTWNRGFPACGRQLTPEIGNP